jgi:2-C-methyl-D-erythritol 4-phosphate cytidylyltransferase
VAAFASVTTACIVVAGGRGERLGASQPKAFVELAGHTLLAHALQRAEASGAVDHLVAVVPGDLVGSVDAERPTAIVTGGRTRRESVALGLTAVPIGVDIVLVHDAARCLAPPQLFAAVAAAVRAGAPVVVPVVAVTDTLTSVEGERVVRTVDRATLRVVQTPQGFQREVLERAHAEAPADHPATDDASLAEALGYPVATVAGSDAAFKITRPLDLAAAEALLAQRHPGA